MDVSMPIYDHCLGCRHNYLLFYQLPNSNLFTHRMLFSREKPLVKTTALGSIFYHIKTKNTLLQFLFIYLFLFLVRSIYQISYNLIYLNTVEGWTTPFTRWVASICCLCAGVVYIVLFGSPTGLITLVEGNTYLCCAASSLLFGEIPT